METQSKDGDSLEKRPGIFFLGSPGVVKRSLISPGVSVWMAHLHDEFFVESLPMYEQLAALILVFDTTELSSLSALQKWVSQTDLQKFDVLVCVGNKVDRVPGLPNIEDDCRSLETRLLMTVQGSLRMESPRLKEAVYWGDDEPFWEARHTCLEWCTEHNIDSLKLALQMLISTNVR